MSDPDSPFIDGIFTDLANASIRPPIEVIEGLLPVGLTFVSGPPKSKKSTLTMAAACICAGYKCKVLPPFMSKARKAGPVMVFSAEATAGELRAMVENEMGVKLYPNESILIADDPWAFRLDDPDGLDKLQHWIEGRDPRLVIIDPLRDFHSLDEKDSGDMNRLLRPLRQWAVQNESSVIIVHHTRKLSDGAADYKAVDMRGSTALFGIADGVLVMTPRKDEAVQIEATFKRAQGWTRTILMAVYGVEVAQEFLDDKDKQVMRLVGSGENTPDNIAAQLHFSKRTVIECLSKLERNALAVRGVGGWALRGGARVP